MAEKERHLVEIFLKALPFHLTEAQEQACDEIDKDLESVSPMNRLLQGDVGSGKTVVAIYALLRCLERGQNGALLAPTEILANQHYLNLKKLVEPLGVQVELSTRSTRPSEETLFSSQPTIYVGTHALIQGKAVIPNFGLGVIDEQHKVWSFATDCAVGERGSSRSFSDDCDADSTYLVLDSLWGFRCFSDSALTCWKATCKNSAEGSRSFA